MALFENFPYTNFHELNLDWLLGAVKKIDGRVDQLETAEDIDYYFVKITQPGGVFTIDQSFDEILEARNNGKIIAFTLGNKKYYDVTYVANTSFSFKAMAVSTVTNSSAGLVFTKVTLANDNTITEGITYTVTV